MTLICASHSLTHSDTLDSDIVWRSLVMEMEVGDAGPSRLGYYNTKQLLQQIRKRNTCHARAPRLHHFLTRAQSAHWREAKMRMRIPSYYNTNRRGKRKVILGQAGRALRARQVGKKIIAIFYVLVSEPNWSASET